MAQAGACACRLTAALRPHTRLVQTKLRRGVAGRGAQAARSRRYGHMETCEEIGKSPKKNLAAAASGGIRHLTLSSQSMLYEIKTYIP